MQSHDTEIIRKMIPADASTLQLPPGPWVSVLDCLSAHFSAIPREQWLDRFARSRILDWQGQPIESDHAYAQGLTIHYFREVADEPCIPFEATIIHADDDLVVADKPHFLAVMPAGRFVEQTLLRRLMREVGNADLVPLHRIDRGTAGLVMFSANPATRAAYQSLFRERKIQKTYEAIAPALPDRIFPLLRRSRIVTGDPFFRMCEVGGEPNSESRIDVISRENEHWHYALEPLTGRKHQLRVHMAGLGAPIDNDLFYPHLREAAEDDYSRPLKLLARSLRFEDPLSSEQRNFTSQLDF